MGWFRVLAGVSLLVAIGIQWSGILKPKDAVNTEKIIADLLHSGANITTQTRAAVSTMYLSEVPSIRDQLIKGGMPIVLLRTLQRADLSRKAASRDLVPALLLTLGKLAASSSSSGSSTGGEPGSSSGSSRSKGGPSEQEVVDRLVADGLMERVLEVIKEDVPGWQAAAGRLLHNLHSGAGRAAVQRFVERNAGVLTTSALHLLEGGAYSDTSDALVSSNQVLELLLTSAGSSSDSGSSSGGSSGDDGEGEWEGGGGRGGPAVGPPVGGASLLKVLTEDHDLPHMLMQILTTHAGKNGSALVTAAVVKVMDLLVQHDKSIMVRLGESGVGHQLMTELRSSQPTSLTPVLGLLGKMANSRAGAEELISAGVLSVCAQLYFQARAQPGWRRACLDIVCDLTRAQRAAAGLGRGEADGGRHLVASLVQVLREEVLPGLHMSALEALRDCAHHTAAATAIAERGGADAAVSLLQRNLTAEGLYPEYWALQTQRTAALLVALLALQPAARAAVLEAGALEALSSVIGDNLVGAGMRQQMRITAAAALVPVLGDDVGLIPRAVRSHLVESLVLMSASDTETEVAVVRKLLRILGKSPDIAQIYEDVGIEV